MAAPDTEEVTHSVRTLLREMAFADRVELKSHLGDAFILIGKNRLRPTRLYQAVSDWLWMLDDIAEEKKKGK